MEKDKKMFGSDERSLTYTKKANATNTMSFAKIFGGFTIYAVKDVVPILVM